MTCEVWLTEGNMNFWTTGILGNSLAEWAIALVIGLFVYGVLRLLTWLLRRRIERYTGEPLPNPSVLIRALLDHTYGIFLIWLAVFTALHSLSLGESLLTIINTVTIAVIIIQAGFWAYELIEYSVARRAIARDGDLNYKKGPVTAILLIARFVVWVIVVILVLENIPGVHVTALFASLGIGGIAIALALQKILGDLFASLTISIDQPFVEGDAINVGEFSGTVEHVGLKSTRVRSATGEQLIFSNSDLIESRIRNYKRMNLRQMVFTLNVPYNTSYKKLQKIPGILKDVIEAQPQVTFNRAHFKSYGPSSLIFEVAYTINTADFMPFMDIQQAINLEIYRRFEDAGIEFALPAQAVTLTK